MKEDSLGKLIIDKHELFTLNELVLTSRETVSL